ncbi:hypothetical protein V6N11_028909 [Hibiscus sabdariffa]|uniref:Uncharacterized protein n=1 Tax=Hibiscus sabdariffa TaxID=183260 RepID=A0ABR2AAU9_9ROSI
MFLQRVKNTLEALYEEYVRLASSGDIMGGSTSLSVAPILLDIDDDDFLEKEFERDLLVAQGKENKSEIDIYLCDDVLQSAIEDLKMLCHAIVGIVFVGMSNCVKVFLKTYYWDVLVGRPLLNTVAAL